MCYVIKIKDLLIGMYWQSFSWKPFEEVTSIRETGFDSNCLLINDKFYMHKESYTYVEDRL